jgi:3-phosphoshikimate 1-carboxyvinyltransferase
MQISIYKSEVQGQVQAPPSKSYTIRGLMCAALSAGRSELVQPLTADDTESAIRVLRQIGIRTNLEDDAWQIQGGDLHPPEAELFCGDSAATMRFMSAICALVPGRCRLTAGISLSKRPVEILIEALRKWGVDISSTAQSTPVIVNGGEISGGLTELPGNISSQYVSALLLVAPLAENACTIRLTAPLESRSYVLMTLECLEKFGIGIKYSPDLREYHISPQVYRPSIYEVEGDWSSASYLLALGSLCGDIRVGNLNMHSLQGDKAIKDYLKEMGASIEVAGESIVVKKSRLSAIKADLNDCIDLFPTLSVLASLAEGTSEFTGIMRARLKESNRIVAIRQGLERAGIKVVEEPDRIMITGGKPRKATINSWNDHRIAMAFSLLGAATGGIMIEGSETVSKTYPEYWKTLRGLGVKLDEQ